MVDGEIELFRVTHFSKTKGWVNEVAHLNHVRCFVGNKIFNFIISYHLHTVDESLLIEFFFLNFSFMLQLALLFEISNN